MRVDLSAYKTKSYICDYSSNIECPKTNCCRMGGTCYRTTDKKYAATWLVKLKNAVAYNRSCRSK